MDIRKAFSPFYLFTITACVCGYFDNAVAINVTSNADTNTTGTLRFALNNLNPAGDTINFVAPFSGSITLTSSLPPIVMNTGAALTINGGGLVVGIDGAHLGQAFLVAEGVVTFSNFASLGIINTLTQGGGGGVSPVANSSGGGGGGGGLGAGGAIMVGSSSASVVLDPTVASLSLNSNRAVGGTGGDGFGYPPGTLSTGPGGGGGGGIRGQGGNGGNPLVYDPNHSISAAGGGGGGGGFVAGNVGGDGTFPTAGNEVGGTGGTGAGGTAGGTGGNAGNPGFATGNPGTSATATGAGGGGGGGGANLGCDGSNGGNGATFGGGGGAGGGGDNYGSATPTVGGAGGFAGGGGGGGTGSNGQGGGGVGGFGGGGGGGGGNAGGSGGFAGGAGGNDTAGRFGGGGGGGGGLGGAVFVRNGGSLTLNFSGSSSMTGNSASGGTPGSVLTSGPGSPGFGFGDDIFLMSGGTVTFHTTADITISSTIASNQSIGGGSLLTGGIVKTGSGKLTLSGTNNNGFPTFPLGYTGTTAINEGTLSIASDANLGALGLTQGAISFNSPGGTLQFTSNTSSNAFTRPISINGVGTIGSIDTDGNDFVLNSVISGTGILRKIGIATLTLTSTNSYSGGTEIDAGTLSVDNDSYLGNTAGNLTFSGGTLEVTSGFTTSARNVVLNAGGGTIQVASGNPTFSGTFTGAGAFTKTGLGTLTLSGAASYTGLTTVSAGTLALSGSSTTTLAGGVTIASGATFNLSGQTAPLTIDNLNGATGSSLLLGGQSLTTGTSANTSFLGVISGGGAFIKQGTGTLTLVAANTYTGGTQINAGTIQIPASSGLGSGGSLTFGGSGGTLELLTSFGSNTLTQNIILNSPGMILTDSGVVATVNNPITGSSSLTKSGPGTLILSGTNTYVGGTQINAGVLQISASSGLGSGGTITFGGSGGTLELLTSFGANTLTQNVILNSPGTIQTDSSVAATVSGTVTGSGALTKSGSGTLTLSGAASYTGLTTISAGTLALSGGATTSLNGGVNIATSGAVFNLSGHTVPLTIGDLNGVMGSAIHLGPQTLTVNTTTADTFNGTVDGSGGFTKAGVNTLTLGGTVTYAGLTTVSGGTVALNGSGTTSLPGGVSISVSGATFDLSGHTVPLTIGDLSGVSGSGLVLGSQSLTVGTTNSTSFLGVISGGGPLIKQGSGTLTLGSANTYTGGTNLNAGTIQISGSGGLGVGGNLTFGGSGGTLEFLTAFGTASLAHNIILNSPGTFQTDTGVAANITGTISGASTLTKTGTGTLTLSGAASYTGLTTVNAGTLAFSGGATSTLSGGVTVANAATFDLSAQTVPFTLGTLNGDTGSALVLDAQSLTLNSASSNSFLGVISGGGPLIKEGSGTLTLGSSNTYISGTQINAGTVQILGPGGLGVGGNLIFGGSGGTLEFLNTFGTASLAHNITLNSPGTFQTDTGVAANITGTISGASTLTKTGTGTLTLSGAASYTGLTAVNAGTLALSGGATSTLSGGLSIASGATFDLSALTVPFTLGDLNGSSGSSLILGTQSFTTGTANNTSFAGVISGDGPLIKQGAGSLTLGGLNTYSGGTQINGGTVQISDPAGLGNGGTLTFGGSGGALELLPAFGTNILIHNIIFNTQGVIQTDGGVVATFSNPISGASVFEKTGQGTLLLGAANPGFTGSTIIARGTLGLSGIGTLPNSPIQVNAEATFSIAGASVPVTVGDLNAAVGSFLLLGSQQLTLGTANSTQILGTIQGSGGSLVKQGSGTLTLSGDNTYTGGTTLNDGTVSVASDANLGNVSGNVTFGGGTLEATDSFTSSRKFTLNSSGGIFDVTGGNVVTLTSPGTFNGTGILVKMGTGTLIIGSTSNSPGFTGSAIIDNGTIEVDGTFLNSPLQPIAVNPNGKLTGLGTVGSVNNNGIVAPGSLSTFVGNLKIDGNYVQGSNALFSVNIDNQGHHDLLTVVTGTASLDGTIGVAPLPGSYFAGQKFTVLQTSGGRGGSQFANLVILNNFPLSIDVLYPTDNIVQLSIPGGGGGGGGNSLFFGMDITKYNPRHVANYLNSLAYLNADGTVIPSQQDLFNVVIALSNLNQSALVTALDQLHPAQFGAFAVVNSNVRSFFSSIINRHPAELCCHRLQYCIPCGNASLWAEPVGFIIDQGPVNDQKGFNASTGGMIMGGDYAFENNIVVGLAAGGSDTYLKWYTSAGNAHIYSGFLSLYADWLWDTWSLEASILGARDFFKASRHIHFTGVDRTAHNKHHGYDITGHLAAGVDFYHKKIVFQPFVITDYFYQYQSSYKEHGAQSLNLAVDAKNEQWLRLEEGVYITKSYATQHGCWSPGFWLSCVSEIPIHFKNYRTSFVNEPGSFTVRSFRKTSNRFSPGIDLAWQVGKCISLSIRYGAEFGPHFIANKGDFRFEWGF